MPDSPLLLLLVSSCVFHHTASQIACVHNVWSFLFLTCATLRDCCCFGLGAGTILLCCRLILGGGYTAASSSHSCLCVGSPTHSVMAISTHCVPIRTTAVSE